MFHIKFTTGRQFGASKYFLRRNQIFTSTTSIIRTKHQKNVNSIFIFNTSFRYYDEANLLFYGPPIIKTYPNAKKEMGFLNKEVSSLN
jgi:hypothetical protein